MDEGVMGLNVARNRILTTLQSAAGYSPLQRIFTQDNGPRHIMTFLLGRLVGSSWWMALWNYMF